VAVKARLKKYVKSYNKWPYRAACFFLILLIIFGTLFFKSGHSKAVVVPFISSGTWTIPANVFSVVFDVWGGGGAGGGSTTNGTAGGGGGGGGYCQKTAAVTPGTIYSITVGDLIAGGTGSGLPGNDSSVQDPSSATICTGTGGGGGGANNGTGGNGGVGLNGDSANTGGNGAAASAGSGGGGGAAGFSGNGGNASGQTAGTGTGPNAGDGGAGIAGTTSNVNGNIGNNYGGGGSGATRKNGTATGGAGAQGYVTATYTPTPLTYDQNSYRFFSNADQADPPGSALAAQNTSVTLSSAGQAFRLRQLIKPNLNVNAGSQNFNEQYADLSSYGTCSAIPSGNWSNLSGDGGVSGPEYAGTGTDVNTSGFAWSSTGNISAADSSYAISTLSSGTGSTNELDATNFGFAIPNGATITGVSVDITGLKVGGAFISTNKVQLVKGGVAGGTDQSNLELWTTTPSTNTWGGTNNLWGQTLTPTDVNASNFGVAFAASRGSLGTSTDLEIDSVTMTVYFTNASGGLSYYDNPTPANGNAITFHAGTDPTDSGTYTAQTYQESDNFGIANNIAANTDGIWDLSIYDNAAPANTTYCLRTVKSDGSTLDTYTQYPQITTAIGNASPGAPTLISPASSATGISTYPIFTLRTNDAEADYLRYRIYLYQSDCSTPVGSSPFNQNASQAGWSRQDASSNTAYVGSATITSSTIATFGLLSSGQSGLMPNTVYCWKADAVDPGGSGNFGSASATQTFTTETSTRPVNIKGNINIRGNTNIR
jgi:hypothetical protein